MNRKQALVLLIAVLCCLALVGLVLAQTSTNFDQSWHVLSNAGATTNSTNFAANGSLSQLAIGIAEDSNYRVESGYWYGSIAAQIEKPLAPNGVHTMSTYESRIGEPGLLIEDPNLQMWVPERYEEHSRVIFAYLQSGYEVLREMFGGHDMPVKFSIEHYPNDSPYHCGCTYGEGTIRYGYSNLEDDTPEWNQYGIPHVVGYYEEMAHCFANDLGIKDEVSVGYYETLGMMIGGETALRAAWNPHIQEHVDWSYTACAASTDYYLEHNTCEPGIPENICLTRILAHIFKTEVVDMYGWGALSTAFVAIQAGYPLRAYDRDHTWGGFLEYLGNTTGSDLHTVFRNYGLPIMQWTGEPGYELDGMEPVGEANRYQFRAKIFDREGSQPIDVQLHLYGSSLWQIGTFNESWGEFDTDPHDDPEVVVFTIGQPDAEFPNGIGTDAGPQRSVIEIHFNGDLSAGSTLWIRWTPGGSPSVEQFSVALNGNLIGQSQALSGELNPYALITEGFELPPTAGSDHTITLRHLTGDGIWWDALRLGACIHLPMSFVEGDAGVGWIYQAEVVINNPVQCKYAFSANDGVHVIFQAVGEPTVKGYLLFGDLNGDCEIDIADIMQVASRWRCRCGDECYNSTHDLDDDGDIDIIDIMLVAAHWGDTC